MRVDTITQELENWITEMYRETYSVSAILRACKGRNLKIGRGRINAILKAAGLYEGLAGENYLKKKVEAHKSLMLEKHGVENWGQTENGGYRSLNKIEYSKLSYLTDEFTAYREKVRALTKKNLAKLPKPDYCEYTGVRFADVEGRANPNDPRKRSIDHKLPVIHCYLNGIPAEDAAGLDNLMRVLKYVNSVKGNTLHESFLPLALKIRKVFQDAGYVCKET